jgi:hypothetical protein
MNINNFNNKIVKYNAQGELMLNNEQYKYKNIPKSDLLSDTNNYNNYNNYNESTYLEINRDNENQIEDNTSWASTDANMSISEELTNNKTDCILKIVEAKNPWYIDSNRDILNLLKDNDKKLNTEIKSNLQIINKENLTNTNNIDNSSNTIFNSSLNQQIFIVTILSSILIAYILYRHYKTSK